MWRMADSKRAGEGGSAHSRDPPYTDAKSLTAESGGEEYMNLRQMGYTDAASISHERSAGKDHDEELYMEASSNPPDAQFHDAMEEQKHKESLGTHAAPPVTAKPSRQQDTGRDTASSDPTDHKHVYFILEKQSDVEESGEHRGTLKVGVGQYKGHTLARSGVNVAARAMMFEETKMSPYGVRTKDSDSDDDDDDGVDEGDPLYDIPPLKEGTPSDAQTAAVGDPSAFKDDDNIYEITFDENQSKSGQRQNFGAQEGGDTVEHQPLRQQAGRKGTDVYELAKPLSSSVESDRSKLSVSGGFMSCLQGVVPMEHKTVVMPSKEEIETEYNRLNFRRECPMSSPEEAGYNTLERLSCQLLDPSTNEPIYEAAPDNRYRTIDSEHLSEASWGSSEFEEYSDEEDGYEAGPDTPAPTKPLPRKPKYASTDAVQATGLLHKIRASTTKTAVDEEVNTVCLPVNINTQRHPPPELPPAPDGLSERQRKRRCVIELTISSERSYIGSLDRIIQEYEKPVLEVITHPKSHIRVVFKEAREILNHHKMFQIELAESVRNWDQQERIGDIFTASFSKSMLVDAYSMYVNNFAAAMDEIRTVQQSRPSFEEFLKMKEKTNHDRLSIFGLMVKPVQRFPQFIMVIQDLIKYTDPTHQDRRSLQLALTELENVAHKLNERKRLSEQYFQAKQTVQLLPRQLPSQTLSARNLDKPRRLIRCDNFDQIDGEMEHMKSSHRRLILLNDHLVCVKVWLKNQDNYMMERYRLKWMARLSDIDLKDMAMTPDMAGVTKMDPNRLKALSAQLEKNEEDPFHLYVELRDMLHDLTVWGQMSTLMKSLKRKYQGHGLSDELCQEVVEDLQRMIQIKDEQLRLVNSCSIILVDNSRADRPQYVMQTPTAHVKNEWCVDFSMAKLALEKQNNPSWDRAPLAGEEDLEPVPALFMKSLPVDVPRHFTKMKCAVPVFVPSSMVSGMMGVQHLWVCTSTATRGQVSVVSLNSTRPALTEMFKACDCDLLCCDVVPGCGKVTHPAKFLFSEDTVWMANVHNEIVIFPVASQGGSTTTRDALAVLRVPGRVTLMRFVDERLFCGLDGGAMVIYSRNDAGEWCVKAGRTLEFGQAPIKCQLVVEDGLWVACGHQVHVLEIDSLKVTAVHKLSSHSEQPIQQMVRCGVGVWVAYHNSAVLRLFHLESMENLQEMSVANIVNRVLAEKREGQEWVDCVVTCLAASTGLLWIGTSLGLVVTLPLPRLSDGVPLYRGHPSVSYHAHRGPVRFIIPVYCSGSVMELHRRSSLRHSLRARPSLRNRKRVQLETEGALVEEKLLSSGGGDLENSHPNSLPKAVSKNTSSNAEDLVAYSLGPPRPSELPKEKGNKFAQRFKVFKNNSSRSGSLAGHGRVKRSRGQTLSFRSELANRIKSTNLDKTRIQAQSMFDLRGDDAFEVEMFYENLLDDGTEVVDNDVESELDGLSMRSDSSLAVGGVDVLSKLVRGSQNRLESLDLVGAAVIKGKMSSSSSTTDFTVSSDTTPSPGETQASQTLQTSLGDVKSAVLSPQAQALASETGMNVPLSPADACAPSQTLPAKSDNTSSSPVERYRSASNPSPPPSPRISLIRANTMRKTSTSNAVMVLSGGDGCVDLSTGNISSRNEDATLLLWIYKF